MFTTIIIFIVVLAALILVHEFGHFIVAKKSGIRVDEFGLGFPPRIFGYKHGETLYSLNWLPFGGFVKIHGEDPTEVNEDDPDQQRSLTAKNRGIQALVMVAGVVMNWLFAWLLISIGLMAGLPSDYRADVPGDVQDPQFMLTSIMPGAPADEAGIKAGDNVTSLRTADGGETLSEITPESFSEFIKDYGNEEEIIFSVERGGEAVEIAVRPEAGVLGDDESAPAVGVTMGMIGTLQLPPHEALIYGGELTADLTVRTAQALGGFFSRIVTGGADFEQVAGPVGIVNLVGSASELGIVYLLQFTALISINLAIINLLPFPALDGGRLILLAIEAVRRKAIDAKVVAAVNTAGFILLIILMLVVTYHDIVKLI